MQGARKAGNEPDGLARTAVGLMDDDWNATQPTGERWGHAHEATEAHQYIRAKAPK